MNDFFSPIPPSVTANTVAIDQLKQKVDASIPDQPTMAANPVAKWFYYATGFLTIASWLTVALQQFLAAFDTMLPDKYKHIAIAFAGLLTSAHMGIYTVCDWYDDGKINKSVPE